MNLHIHYLLTVDISKGARKTASFFAVIAHVFIVFFFETSILHFIRRFISLFSFFGLKKIPSG